MIDARDKPKKREFQYFKRSPCGRFTFTSWWPDGSNYPFADALLEMRGDAKPTPPVREKKSKFGHTSHFAYGPSNCRITPDILGMHEDEVRAARKRWAEKRKPSGARPNRRRSLIPHLICMARSIGKRQLDRQNIPRRNTSTTTSSSASARPRSVTSSRSGTLRTYPRGPGSTRTSRKKGSLMIKEHGPWTATSL